MNIRFEAFTDKYLDKAAEIYNYYVQNTTVTFHTEAVTPEEMRNILYQDDTMYITLAILDGDVLCGYAYMAPYKKRQAYRVSAEVTVYLSPEAVGRGIGVQALERLEAHAKEHDIRTLLAVICAENQASIRLFSKCGYEQCAYMKEVGIKFQRLLDVVIMQKLLKS
jgi:phosphinothricin acetyltransferase